MSNKFVTNIKPLGFTWETRDPFLFCAHHRDDYPAGNDQMGPAASLAGRNLGQDFTLKDGWRMYHGEKIPGFPAHPHRGFETVTVTMKGLVDHSDSHGAAGRYGNGDVQWMTAGAGLQHAEMFPLLDRNNPNPAELFQLWLNLPSAKKLCKPYFSMFWADKIPVLTTRDEHGKQTRVNIIAGKLNEIAALPPAPDSWAADPANEVAIWLINLEANARWTIPPASPGLNRVLYYYKGASINVSGVTLNPLHSADLKADHAAILENGSADSYLLLLQGRPINEPVVQHGPFVMNTEQEIRETFRDYRETQFGGWPWPRYDHVHPREKGRFARYADGREELQP